MFLLSVLHLVRKITRFDGNFSEPFITSLEFGRKRRQKKQKSFSVYAMQQSYNTCGINRLIQARYDFQQFCFSFNTMRVIYLFVISLKIEIIHWYCFHFT